MTAVREMTLDEAAVDYLRGQARGRLATVGPDGAPQNKPVGFVYNAELGTIDIAGFEMERSAKYRNVGVNPEVAFVVDDAIGEGAEGMRFLEIRGTAERVAGELIRIHPRRAISWNVDPDKPGMQTRALDHDHEAPEPERPALGASDAATGPARDAVVAFVAELQTGWDEHDADITNRHFADDIVWGSPFGATLQGYEQLHAIHVKLKQQSRGGNATRFETVRVLAPSPNVAVAQVKRVGLDADGNPVEPSADVAGAFSEIAMYVLVRRGRTWWLAAGQNTLVRPPPA